MKVRQQNIKSFDIEIEDEVEFFAYFNKNLPLLQSHLMILRGKVSDGVKVYLQNKKVAFVDANEVSISTKRAKKIEAEVQVKKIEVEPEDMQVEKEECIQSLMLNRTIRSGENIEHKSDITIFGRINSGAKIVSDANIQIFGTIEGDVEAKGDYILLQGIGMSGHVVLHNEKVDSSKCRDNMTLVKMNTSGLVYKAI